MEHKTERLKICSIDPKTFRRTNPRLLSIEPWPTNELQTIEINLYIVIFLLFLAYNEEYMQQHDGGDRAEYLQQMEQCRRPTN